MSKAQTRATAKYNAKAYEEIKLRVKNGQKEEITAHAKALGLSLNGYINRLIAEDMKRTSADQSEEAEEQ